MLGAKRKLLNTINQCFYSVSISKVKPIVYKPFIPNNSMSIDFASEYLIDKSIICKTHFDALHIMT